MSLCFLVSVNAKSRVADDTYAGSQSLLSVAKTKHARWNVAPGSAVPVAARVGEEENSGHIADVLRIA